MAPAGPGAAANSAVARRVLTALLVPAALLFAVLLGGRATAATASIRYHAYRYAQNQIGCWYQWGAAGPCSSGFDCSGLVHRAYMHAGLWIPRDTYEMLSYWRLKRIPSWDVRRGDLAFYGSGHVEMVTGRLHYTLGALESGTQVGYHRWWWGDGWNPTEWFHVRGAH